MESESHTPHETLIGKVLVISHSLEIARHLSIFCRDRTTVFFKKRASNTGSFFLGVARSKVNSLVLGDSVIVALDKRVSLTFQH